ncbi:hypothetical protein L6452_16044 [Arctium lappa]|uniref:Uncharacterized protein n=1 Tax=Arctium lappa TaxID=4217 RepID=A0ACB9CQD4_ARCLA|nr:hypothetical protein L6452_16044 [Arctium lappa]
MGISGSIPGFVSGSVAQNVHQANRRDQKKENLLNSFGSNSRSSMSRSLKKSTPRRRLKKIEAQIGDMDVNSLINLNSVKDVNDRRGDFSFGKSRSEGSKYDAMIEDRSIGDSMVQLKVESTVQNGSVDVSAGCNYDYKPKFGVGDIDNNLKSMGADHTTANSNSIPQAKGNFEVYNKLSYFGSNVVNASGTNSIPQTPNP